MSNDKKKNISFPRIVEATKFNLNSKIKKNENTDDIENDGWEVQGQKRKESKMIRYRKNVIQKENNRKKKEEEKRDRAQQRYLEGGNGEISDDTDDDELHHEKKVSENEEDTYWRSY